MSDELELESLYLGAHPLVSPLLRRLRLRRFLEQALGPPHPRAKLSPVDSTLVMLRNVVLCRHPLDGVPEWVRRFAPEQLELTADQIRLVNDDRLGRTLDKLFKLDLRTLMTRIVVHMVEAFDLALERLHNDSTSITFSGVYREKPARKDGLRRLKITHGHNKDHRPDLKQLVWVLTVTADGGVPVHYNVRDGNANDSETHIETWETLRRIAGRSDFIYVADCKLCTQNNMRHIAGNEGHFITVLPSNRKEDARFKDWILHRPVPWEVIWERPPLRRKDDPPERFEAVEGPEPTAEGFRLVWYRSSEKWTRDQRARDHAIQQARFELQRLAERAGKRKLKTREQVHEAVEEILDQTAARAWVKVALVPQARHSHKQVGPGRPSKHTRYVRQTTVVYEPVATLDAEAIRASAAADGIFPLVTDMPAQRISPLELLQTYKYQAFVEKRHEQLKTVAEVVPVNFKSVERIEAFLFLYFLALTIHALLERQVRHAMRARNLKALPIYPEKRMCRAPTADRILELFEPLRRHRLFKRGDLVKTFWDELDDVHHQVLDLLEVSPKGYGS